MTSEEAIPYKDNYAIYAYDLSLVPMTLPPGRCDALLDEARVDPLVREHVLHSLLPTIRGYACRLHRSSASAPTTALIDTMELVCVGNLVLVENMLEALLYRANPLAFLLKCARLEMMSHCQQYGHGPITYPRSGAMEDLPCYRYVHLEDVDTDLFDILDPSQNQGQSQTANFDAEADTAPLYEALDALSTDDARSLVTQLFGLFWGETRTLIELAGGGNSSTKAYKAKK